MDSRDDAQQRELVERMRNDAAANGDYQGAADLDAALSDAATEEAADG